MNQDAANKLAVLGVIKKKVAEAEAQYRNHVIADTEAGEKRNAKAGDKRTATVYMTDPGATWRVTDRGEFIRWVQANRPEEIETVHTVNSAFEKAVLEAEGVLPNADGEALDVSGVALVAGNPSLTVRLERDADQTIAAWLAQEGITPGAFLDDVTRDLAQIEAGEQA